jgi:hypothetical protein
MDYFYDGQIRRYVTQFMRFFIGFKYQTNDGTQRHVPVSYGDLSRQVAQIIKENSENKMPSVPKIACYITGLELDKSRLTDASFVSKIHIREREFDIVDNERVYGNTQGGTYTIERLMPTPYILKMKADIWTSNTDQKLQLIEQILVFFNPSFEIQTTDNYIDWTSLTAVHLESTNFSSRTIPAGAESEIDICSLEFSMPIYVSPPAKVKKLGIVQNVIMNIFTEQGDILDLENLTYGDERNAKINTTPTEYGVLLLKSPNGDVNDYDVSILDSTEAVSSLGLEVPIKLGPRIDWNSVIPLYGSYKPGLSKIFFLQPNGTELRGTFTINPVDPTYLLVNIEDKPSNTIITSSVYPNGKTTIDAIINPRTFNPIVNFGSLENIPAGTRYLMLEGVNLSENVGQTIDLPSVDSTRANYDGPDAWKNLDGEDPVIYENSIIEWSGSAWETILDPEAQTEVVYITNLRTGMQYKLENGQWIKSFEGEYVAGSWRFDLNP